MPDYPKIEPGTVPYGDSGARVAVVYLSYHCEPYLKRALDALSKSSFPRARLALIIVDNPHPVYGSSAEFIKKSLADRSDLPQTVLLPQEKNLGFAAGNNVGINWALNHGFDYVFLHNQDGFMGLDCLERCSNVFKMDAAAGAVQPLIALYPETNLINTAGNQFHYLGFGYCGHYRLPIFNLQSSIFNNTIAYASGAALMMRAGLLKKYGGLDENFVAYHEDLELGLRLRAFGFKNVLAPAARFYHQYQFSQGKNKYYLMERNRVAVMLMYYKWPTLILFAPMCLIVELGVWALAILNGWGRQKLLAAVHWLRAKNWRTIFSQRKTIQANRRISDRELLRLAVGKIEFEDADFQNPLLKYLGNPIMQIYFTIAKMLIFW